MKIVKFVSLFLFLFILQANAQKTITYPTGKGVWTFNNFSGDIMKATFQPENYLHNEQISNAVISKPAHTISSQTKIFLKENGNVDLHFLELDFLF